MTSQQPQLLPEVGMKYFDSESGCYLTPGDGEGRTPPQGTAYGMRKVSLPPNPMRIATALAPAHGSRFTAEHHQTDQ
jgi:hypothetical protein